MSQAIPVDYEPFSPALEPVDYDPFAATDPMLALRTYADQLGAQPTPGATHVTQPGPDMSPGSPYRWGQAIMGTPGRLAGGLAQSLWSGLALPGDVMSGKVDVSDPSNLSDETMGRVLGLAGMAAAPFASGVEQAAGKGVLGASLRNSVASGEESLASRSASIYNPPVKPLRSFEADYPPKRWPDGLPVDAQGNLTHSIDGNPLGAPYIVGRRTLGRADEALSPAEAQSAGTEFAGASYSPVPPRSIGGDAGRNIMGRNPETGDPQHRILISNQLSPFQADRVVGHELGHSIDELSGQIPTSGLSSELRGLYNTLNTGRERTSNLMGPQHLGYSADDVPREYMAEAIRAYMADPNYMKTVAPKTAARIRAYVNSNPRLNQTIQFNSGGIPWGGGNLIPVDYDPFPPDGYI